MYYRSNGGKIPNLRGEGLPVDIKSGPNSYVVGSCSIRPDGGKYSSLKGLLGETKLPIFLNPDTSRKTARPHKIRKGTRHNAIRSKGLEIVHQVSSGDALFQALLEFRNDKCEDPASMTDDEIRKIADWCWGLRGNNQIWEGDNSVFRIRRNELKALAGNPDSIALFSVLQCYHGHTPGKSFALVHKSMKSEGLIDLSRDRFRAARNHLIYAGLLEKALNHQARRRRCHYRLVRLTESPDPSVVRFSASNQEKERKGV